jgi:hypothetical protein
MTAEEIYDDILWTLLNGKGSGQLNLKYLTGEKVGEILLVIGENEPFGVIDVGDSTTLKKNAEEAGFNVTTSRFTTSYFQSITDDPNCPINVLIGSNKFIEGWSCWRVSMMGLMEMGKGAGSKIIQLFGRGVRLKGREFTLKRSKALPGMEIPDSLTSLETLNIFGIKSHYISQFLKYLDEEDLGPKDMTSVTIPTSTQLPEEVSLKYLYLDQSIDFTTDGGIVEFGSIPASLKQRRLVVDLYPRIVNIASDNSDNPDPVTKSKRYLRDANLAFIDWMMTYKKLLHRKNSKKYYNALIDPSTIESLFDDSSWYEILCPESTLAVSNLESNIQSWQNIVDNLALSYLDRIYASSRDEWQRNNNLNLGILTEENPNLIDEWKMEIDSSMQQIIVKANELRENYSQGKHEGVSHSKFRGTHYTRHLYNPLLYLSGGVNSVKISPEYLNEGEEEFVKDLQEFYDSKENQMMEHTMCLLRNQSKTGIGFFSDGNFFPDFIMWLVVEGHQYITFIDPKGLYHANSLNHPKIRLSSNMGNITNDIRKRNNDQEITLNSFIISVTPKDGLGWGEELDKTAFTNSNVLFQKDDKASYIETMLQKIIPNIFPS